MCCPRVAIVEHKAVSSRNVDFSGYKREPAKDPMPPTRGFIAEFFVLHHRIFWKQADRSYSKRFGVAQAWERYPDNPGSYDTRR
jgi:hypothetical protein